MHALLEKQQTLHNEATELLEKFIYPILNKFGDIEVGGSYVYKLLSHPDIDLSVVNSNLTKQMFADLCAELIALENVFNFRSCDRANFAHRQTGERPTGYWISPTVDYEEHEWNLDIWFQTPKHHSSNTDFYLEKLTKLSDEKRITILSLKEELMRENIYGVGKEFQSVDIYNGVLENNIQNVDDLRKFKASKVH